MYLSIDIINPEKSYKSLPLFIYLLFEEEEVDYILKVLDCGRKVREFKLQSYYYVHFRTNRLGKDMNHLSLPMYGLNSITAILL